jgi:hypothetical protein
MGRVSITGRGHLLMKKGLLKSERTYIVPSNSRVQAMAENNHERTLTHSHPVAISKQLRPISAYVMRGIIFIKWDQIEGKNYEKKDRRIRCVEW